MNESEAIEILLDNKKEYEEIIKELEDVIDGNDKPIKTIKDCQKFVQAIETILDLYKKTKYELEGKECLIDTMTHNEEVLTRNYEILENKLQQEKEKNKEALEYIARNGGYKVKL